MNNILKAKKLNYKICLYYVYVSSVDIAIDRVKSRVLAGGHDVPVSDIKRRFAKSIETLREIESLCDELIIFDNSIILTKVFARIDNQIILYNKNYSFLIR